MQVWSAFVVIISTTLCQKAMCQSGIVKVFTDDLSGCIHSQRKAVVAARKIDSAKHPAGRDKPMGSQIDITIGANNIVTVADGFCKCISLPGGIKVPEASGIQSERAKGIRVKECANHRALVIDAIRFREYLSALEQLLFITFARVPGVQAGAWAVVFYSNIRGEFDICPDSAIKQF